MSRRPPCHGQQGLASGHPLGLNTIEASTGLNGFSRIANAVQNELEGGVDGGLTE